jgi:hypothetical protein
MIILCVSINFNLFGSKDYKLLNASDKLTLFTSVYVDLGYIYEGLNDQKKKEKKRKKKKKKGKKFS